MAEETSLIAQHNITKANYYYRLKRVRQMCLDQISDAEQPAFVELQQPEEKGTMPAVEVPVMRIENVRGLSAEIFSSATPEHYLRVFLEDGDVPMDNNASGRAIRGFCIGKKNWEMIDTINGASSSAIIYSIAETANANQLKPYDYFEYLLTELPKHMDDNNNDFLAELLPWSETLPEHIRKPVKSDDK